MSAATHKRKSYTTKLKLEACEYAENSCFKSRTPYIHKKINVASWRCLTEAGSLIQAGSPIQAGRSRAAFVLIEAGGLY